MYKNKAIKPFEKMIYLSSPTMHGEELKYMSEAYNTNWMSTVGENINAVEKLAAENSGVKYAVALCNCTSALHLCVKLAGEELYGKAPIGKGCLEGKRVFCSDMTFSATLNPIIYEGGIPVFIDTEIETWNMDPIALEKAFSIYPDVKLVVCAELYGFPGGIDVIKNICEKHNALLIEDAAEAMGATVCGKKCGSFGDYSAISYNGNKIITGSSGGCLLTNNSLDADKARKWSTQSREKADWYQHEDVGYNYRMSNVIAGVIRGQYLHLYEHIAQKKAIYERYKLGFIDLPVRVNNITNNTCPNYWLSCMIIDEDAMCEQTRNDNTASYVPEDNKTCPTEVLEALASIKAEGRPIWKPMHMQPLYKNNDFIVKNGSLRLTETNKNEVMENVGENVFQRGLCLPSDNKMTENDQDKVIEVIKRCFD